MSEVTISGRKVVIERFTLAKAMRVITLLQLLQKEVPEISKEWATFHRDYAKAYGTDIDRIQALARYGPALEHVSDAEWERAGQKFRIPGAPTPAEVFFAMAPLIYEKAEAVTLRLLGLIAMENDVVNRYVKSGDIWDRVDEVVDEVIRPAALDEIMELAITAGEIIDGQVLEKARKVGERAGNLARLLGLKTTSSPSQDSTTSSESPDEPRTTSPSDSPSTSATHPTSPSDSPGTSSRTSESAYAETTS